MPTVADTGSCEKCGTRFRSPGVCKGTMLKPHEAFEVRPFDADATSRPGLCEDVNVETGEQVSFHEVRVKAWPPKFKLPQSRRPASVSGVCRKCEASVIVYDPPQEGIILVLPDGTRYGEKKAAGKA